MHFVLSGEEADMAEGKILMVDDDKEIADLVEIHLKGEGYQVYKAYNWERSFGNI